MLIGNVIHVLSHVHLNNSMTQVLLLVLHFIDGEMESTESSRSQNRH